MLSEWAISVFIGSENETQTVNNLAQTVTDAHDYGLPVLGITAVGKELEKERRKVLSFGLKGTCRNGDRYC